MVHSAGSAIFSGLRMEIHRHKLKYILDPRSGRWGRKGRPSPSVPISGSEKRGDYLSGSQQKSLFCFSIASPPPVRKPWYRWISGWPPHPSCCCGCGSRWRQPGAPLLTVFCCSDEKSQIISEHQWNQPPTPDQIQESLAGHSTWFLLWVGEIKNVLKYFRVMSGLLFW